jgi:hypothetical protein
MSAPPVAGVDLRRHDFLRAPLAATARPEGFVEWHHFLVHAPDLRLLVNLSLTAEPIGDRVRLVPRVIVLVWEAGRWAGAVDRFAPADLDISADLNTLVVAGNRVEVDPDGYRVVLDLPRRGLAGELRLTAPNGARPVTVTNRPLGTGRLNWLFVPLLHADGWFGGHRLDRAPAYHDHNWGRFRWGADFGWTWGTVLPAEVDDPWSLVFMRMTDRHRLRCRSAAVYLCHAGAPVAVYRDAKVRIRSVGLLGHPPDCTLPPPMGLVLGGVATDVPRSLEVEAGDGELRAELTPRSHARLALPSAVHPDRSVVLTEVAGPARVRAAGRGRHPGPVDLVGTATVEQLGGWGGG